MLTELTHGFVLLNLCSAVIRFLARCRRCRGMNAHALDEALTARKIPAETVTRVAHQLHTSMQLACEYARRMHLVVAFCKN
jgi:hypothetical protein